MKTQPPYPAVAVANRFLRLSFEEDLYITQMKLQKLIYFAHGWHLALFDTPLIAEDIEAWDYGPVVRQVYQYSKEFGSDPITRTLDKSRLTSKTTQTEVPESDERTRALLKRVWDEYKNYSASELSAATHKKQWAWHRRLYDEKRSGQRKVAIPNEYIQRDFTNLREGNA